MTRHTKVEKNIMDIVLSCQAGDEDLRNHFIKQYLPFIVKNMLSFISGVI